MTTHRLHLLRRRFEDDGGFTLTEALVAVTILAIAVIMTIGPVTNAMRTDERSEQLVVGENLAQAKIEEIRSLDYSDVGNPGYTPSGVIQRGPWTETIEGVEYVMTAEVEYVGSLTGLDVVDPGGAPSGDGIQGAWDPGVDYKLVTVTVQPEGRPNDLIRMETIVAPDTIGGHQNIANGIVQLVLYAPFGAYTAPIPEMQVQSAGPALRSGSTDQTQVFPGLDPGTYTVDFFAANGWAIHPDDITSGADEFNAQQGLTVTGTVRIYRPVTLHVNPFDQDTSLPIPDSEVTVTLVDLATSQSTTFPKGQVEFSNLVPGAFDVTVAAPSYFPTATTNVQVTGDPAVDSLDLDVDLLFDPTPKETITFHAETWIASGTYTAIRGADVHVTHAGLGIDEHLTTDANGNATIEVPTGNTGFSAYATSPYGHASPSAQTFDSNSGPITLDFNLYRPSSMRRWVVKNVGDTIYVQYRKTNSPADSSWRLPNPLPNSDGIVTMVVPAGKWRIQAMCTPSTFKGQTHQWTSGSSTTKTWTSGGNC